MLGSLLSDSLFSDTFATQILPALVALNSSCVVAAAILFCLGHFFSSLPSTVILQQALTNIFLVQDITE